ncbi:hypothetical protein BAOM_0892 [Peribacillus asahii]|uniref:Uncharacterized protein n=1 Tax=Peribacillus asahii TaxID=228899 RepID=A0A3Q9RH64_9BACI|nr:hypothetical protein BAOM_0892 [Peribacillus asahii]
MNEKSFIAPIFLCLSANSAYYLAHDKQLDKNRINPLILDNLYK